jgi:hypothetical protein
MKSEFSPLVCTFSETPLVDGTINCRERIQRTQKRKFSALSSAAHGSVFQPDFRVEKINVLTNFLIHISPANWLHCGGINQAEYFSENRKQL